MSEQQSKDEIPVGHTYDGIQEFDNPMPGWWKGLFALTLAFAGLYFSVATLSGGQLSPIAYYDRAVLDEMKKSGVLKGDAATLIRLSQNPDMVKNGAAIFAANCVACHNRDASGLIGPNLTDEYYINVEHVEDLVDVITKGRKNGAMPSWANRLNNNEIVMVASYVASLRGKNLPGKPPEGKQIAPWGIGN